jgi:RNA polymerase sigma factor (sigma-70 family)
VRRPVPVAEADSGGTVAVADGRDEELWSAVRALPPKQRAAVVLRFVNDFSHREVAAVLDCSEEAARRSLHEGLGRLRREMG